jgi:thiol:disulfide interchange protein DsbD
MNPHFSMFRPVRSAARAILVLTVCAGLAGLAAAKPWWMRGAAVGEQDFLPPDVAFRVGAHLDGDVLRVRWVIAEGYYLYRNKIEVSAESADLQMGPVQLPQGTQLIDPLFGPQEVYLQQVEATARLTRLDFGAHPVQVKIVYQGCAQAGLCYPPITRVLFPESAAQPRDAAAARAPLAWETAAILGGCLAFLCAGLWLRKGRRLETPAP